MLNSQDQLNFSRRKHKGSTSTAVAAEVPHRERKSRSRISGAMGITTEVTERRLHREDGEGEGKGKGKGQVKERQRRRRRLRQRRTHNKRTQQEDSASQGHRQEQHSAGRRR